MIADKVLTYNFLDCIIFFDIFIASCVVDEIQKLIEYLQLASNLLVII